MRWIHYSLLFARWAPKITAEWETNMQVLGVARCSKNLGFSLPILNHRITSESRITNHESRNHDSRFTEAPKRRSTAQTAATRVAAAAAVGLRLCASANRQADFPFWVWVWVGAGAWGLGGLGRSCHHTLYPETAYAPYANSECHTKSRCMSWLSSSCVLIHASHLGSFRVELAWLG